MKIINDGKPSDQQVEYRSLHCGDVFSTLGKQSRGRYYIKTDEAHINGCLCRNCVDISTGLHCGAFAGNVRVYPVKLKCEDIS